MRFKIFLLLTIIWTPAKAIVNTGISQQTISQARSLLPLPVPGFSGGQVQVISQSQTSSSHSGRSVPIIFSNSSSSRTYHTGGAQQFQQVQQTSGYNSGRVIQSSGSLHPPRFSSTGGVVTQTQHQTQTAGKPGGGAIDFSSIDLGDIQQVISKPQVTFTRTITTNTSSSGPVVGGSSSFQFSSSSHGHNSNSPQSVYSETWGNDGASGGGRVTQNITTVEQNHNSGLSSQQRQQLLQPGGTGLTLVKRIRTVKKTVTTTNIVDGKVSQAVENSEVIFNDTNAVHHQQGRHQNYTFSHNQHRTGSSSPAQNSLSANQNQSIWSSSSSQTQQQRTSGQNQNGGFNFHQYPYLRNSSSSSRWTQQNHDHQGASHSESANRRHQQNNRNNNTGSNAYYSRTVTQHSQTTNGRNNNSAHNGARENLGNSGSDYDNYVDENNNQLMQSGKQIITNSSKKSGGSTRSTFNENKFIFYHQNNNRTTTQSPAVKRWDISTSEFSNNRKQVPMVVTTLSTTTRTPPRVTTTLKTTSRPVVTTTATRPTVTTTLRITQRPTTTRPTVTTTLKTTQRPTMVTSRPTTTTTLKTTQRSTTTTTRPTTTTTLKTTQRSTTTTTRPTTTTTLKTTQRSTATTTRPTTTTTLKTTQRPTVTTTRPTTTRTLKTTSKPAVTTTTPITTSPKATTKPAAATTVTILTTKPHVVITTEKITPHSATTTVKTTAAPIVTVTYSDFGSQRFRESGTAEGMHRERDKAKAIVTPCLCEYGGLLHSSFIIFMWICLLFLIISFLVFALYMLRKLQLLKMGGGNNNNDGNELDGDGDASLSSNVEVLDRYSQPPSRNNGYENLSSQKCMSFRPGKFALASLSPVRGMGETVETTRALKSIMDGDGGQNEAQVDGNINNSIQTNIKTSTLGPSNNKPSALTWSESEIASSRARSLSPPPMEYKNLVSPSLIRQAHQTEMESLIIPKLSIQQAENENEGDPDNNQKDYSWAEEINRMQTTCSKRLISNTNTDSNTNSGESDCTSATGNNYTETNQKQVSRTEQAPVGVGDPVDEIISCHQNENQDSQTLQQQKQLQQRQDVKRSDDGYYQTTITDMDLMSKGNTNRNDEIDRKALETATSGKTFQNGVEITTVTTTRKIITTTTATVSGEIQKQEEIINLPEDIQIMNDVDDYFKFIDED